MLPTLSILLSSHTTPEDLQTFLTPLSSLAWLVQLYDDATCSPELCPPPPYLPAL